MSFRTVVLIAASVIIGIACTTTVSTEVFARVPAGTTRYITTATTITKALSIIAVSYANPKLWQIRSRPLDLVW